MNTETKVAEMSKLAEAVKSLLVSTYRKHDGSDIKGQAISFLSSELRDRGWKNVSNLYNLEDELKKLGFKVGVEAQLISNGKAKRFARIVTL